MSETSCNQVAGCFAKAAQRRVDRLFAVVHESWNIKHQIIYAAKPRAYWSVSGINGEKGLNFSKKNSQKK